MRVETFWVVAFVDVVVIARLGSILLRENEKPRRLHLKFFFFFFLFSHISNIY